MSANRATPVQLRKSLAAAAALVKAGIRFVPMPVADDAEHGERVAEMLSKLEEMERSAAQ